MKAEVAGKLSLLRGLIMYNPTVHVIKLTYILKSLMVTLKKKKFFKGLALWLIQSMYRIQLNGNQGAFVG